MLDAGEQIQQRVELWAKETNLSITSR